MMAVAFLALPITQRLELRKSAAAVGDGLLGKLGMMSCICVSTYARWSAFK